MLKSCCNFFITLHYILFQHDFLKTYLDEMLAGSSRAISYSNEKRLKEVDTLAKEVEGFFVVVNLLWTLWSLSQGISSKIDFGYWVGTYKDIFMIILYIYTLDYIGLGSTFCEVSASPIFLFLTGLCRRKDAILFSL